MRFNSTIYAPKSGKVRKMAKELADRFNKISGDLKNNKLEFGDRIELDGFEKLQKDDFRFPENDNVFLILINHKKIKQEDAEALLNSLTEKCKDLEDGEKQIILPINHELFIQISEYYIETHKFFTEKFSLSTNDQNLNNLIGNLMSNLYPMVASNKMWQVAEKVFKFRVTEMIKEQSGDKPKLIVPNQSIETPRR